MKTNIQSLLILFLLLFSSCSREDNIYPAFSGFTQGTTYSVIFDNEKGMDVDQVKSDIETLLQDFDNSLSTYNPSSLITAINNNHEVYPDSLFLTLYKRAREIWEMTDGAFDITAGPLVNAWGFGPDSQKRFNESALDTLLELVGMEKISIVEGKVLKRSPGIYLDVNAIAQGYSVDILSDYFEETGVYNYLVEVGGEVRTRGTKARGEKWKVGIDKPVENDPVSGRDLQAVIILTDKSMATSGNYRRFYIDEETGIKYSHTIDPKTGYPVRQNLLSATIVTDDCMSADAFATACMVLGLERSIELVGKYPFLDAYLIFSDDKGNFNTWASEGMKKYIGK